MTAEGRNARLLWTKHSDDLWGTNCYACGHGYGLHSEALEGPCVHSTCGCRYYLFPEEALEFIPLDNSYPPDLEDWMDRA